MLFKATSASSLIPRLLHHLVWLGLFLAPVACASSSEHQFSMLAGFSNYFATLQDGVPSQQEQQLLTKHLPTFFVGKDQSRPIDFYQDYIANGSLHYCDGEILADAVTPDILNRYRSDPLVCFDYTNPDLPTRKITPVYGRIDYAKLGNKQLTFLSYNLVFARSGILQGLPWYKSFPLWLAGSLDDWHQLDNYITAIVVLNSKQQPIALMLQQHNYQTSYIPGLHFMPEGPHWSVDIARRSNELYPHNPQQTEHRAVSFPTPDSMPYLISGENPGWISGLDVTTPETQLQTTLVFLPKEDAFYRFVGRLGDKRLLPGRSAPPGAEFNTLPQLKPYQITLLISYRRPDNDPEYIELYKSWYKGFNSMPNADVQKRYLERFVNDLQQVGMGL